MKIDNNGLTPVSSQRTDGIQPASKKNAGQVNRTSISGKDRAEVTDSARLFAKARASLESAQEVENERLDMLKQQIQSGNYEVPVEELAKRLLSLRSVWNEGAE